jgi:hypothetical protein
VRWDARVPKYDAFGREIGDDPLAGLRDEVAQPQPVDATVAEPEPEPAPGAEPEPAPVAEPEPVFVPRPPRAEVARPRRRRSRGLAGLLVVAAVIGAAGLATNSAVEQGSDIIDSITPQEAPPAPVGVQGRSLIRRANFAAALETLQGAGVGRPMMLRVAPDRIDATVVKDGKLHQLQLTADGELRELGSGTAGATRATVGYGAIDAAAPERLTRAGATRKHPARSIDYVLFTAGPPTTWGAYFKRGRIVIGDRHGRPQRVL